MYQQTVREQVFTVGNVTLGRFEGNLPIAVTGDALSRVPCGFEVYNCPRCHD